MTDAAADPRFRTTRWSVVVAAGGAEAVAAREALGALCATYWYPLYAFARRRGAGRDEAADLVQGFFAALIEKDWAADADPERGRFRAFLLTAFKRFCAKEHRRDVAAKRGGGRAALSLDFDDGEARYSAEPAAADADPERAYERRWALTVLDRALARTRTEFEAAGRGELYAALAPFVAGTGAPDAPAVAASLGMSEGAVRVAVHRLRARYRASVRAEIRDTVADDAAVDDEIRRLMAAVAV